MAKRILIVVPSLKIGGGAERIAMLVGNALHDKGYDVRFLTFYKHRKEYKIDCPSYSFAEKESKGILSKISKMIKRPLKINSYCKKHEINNIISFMEEANFASIMSKTFGKKKIFASTHIVPDDYYGLLYQTLIRFLYPYAKKLVLVSKELESKVRKRYGLKNTTTIYNMMDVNHYKKLMKQKCPHANFFKGSFVFLNIGRMTEQKGHCFLIRSFAEVARTNTKAKLCIISGGGELKHKLTRLIDGMGIENKVLIIEKVENVFPYIRESHCFVLSSLFEGFGIVLVEALLGKMPVVSTDCSVGPREILATIFGKINYPYEGTHGILVKPFKKRMVLDNRPLDPEEKQLAEVMENLMKDKDLYKNYSKSKRADDFDVSEIVSQSEGIL